MALPAAFATSSPYVANPSLYGTGPGTFPPGFGSVLPPLRRSRFGTPRTPVQRSLPSDAPSGTAQNALPVPGSISAATAQTPETNVTSEFLETPSALVPSEVTMASPEMNGLFGEKAPSYTGLLQGQETPVPGSLFSPLNQIGGGVVESTPAVSDPLAASSALTTQNAAEGAGSGAVSGGSAALSGILGTVLPFLAPLAALVPFLFQGANPYQVGPAKAQQPFEVAADDVYNAVKGGYVTPAQGVQAIQNLEQGAQTSLQNVLAKVPASDMNQKIAGTPAQVQNILSNEAQQIENLGNVAPASGTPNWASLFLNPSTKGWYPTSIPTGNEMAQQLLNSLVPGLSAAA